jgi:hypothetical protein
MAMQTNAWMTNFLFEKFLSFFNRFVLNGISQSNFYIGWAWFTHNIKSHKIGVGVKHDYLALSY